MRGIAAAALVSCFALAGCGDAGTKPVGGTRNVTIEVLKQGAQVLAIVPVRIDGHGPYRFAIDTGAAQSLVDLQVARELGVEPSGRKRIAGVSSVKTVASIRVRHWRAGDVVLPATTIVEANLPFGNEDGGVQGLLGSDVLSRFDTITIDYTHSRLVLHHRASH